MQCWDAALPTRSVGNQICIPRSEETHLGMPRAHRHRLRDLLVDNDMNFDALLSFLLEEAIQAPFRPKSRRASQVEFRTQPGRALQYRK